MITKQYNLKGLKIGEKIGNGRFGVVFSVISQTGDKKFAAKLLNDDEDEKLANEINNHSKCNHPAIVKFYGYNKSGFPSNRKPTILLEYVPNGTLQKLLEKQNKAETTSSKILKYKDKLIIAYGIISAMAYLHKNGIIHRDLKPDNILIDKNFYPKVSDLGLSKETFDKSIISSGMQGTPIYIAPEIIENGEYSKFIDVYAFGFVLYQIFVDPKPFNNIKTEFKLYQKILDGKRPEFHDDTPEIIKNLINRCWNQEAKLRPTFDSLLIELKETPQYFNSLTKNEKKEFDRYVNFIDNSHTSFNKDKYVINSSCDGSSTSESFKESLPLWKQYKRMADDGNADAMYQYAFMLENGIGVKKNIEKAFEYYILAADNDQLDAIKKCIFILENGDCIDKDEKKASLYLKKAAELGDVESMVSYGYRLKNGLNGVKIDKKKAFNYFKKAALKNNKNAFYLYALMLKDGERDVCKQNIAIAAEYFKRAADKGVVDAMFIYAKLKKDGDVGVSVNLKEATKYFKLAADNNHIESMIFYGSIMENGVLYPPVYDEACKYYKKAALTNDPIGMFHYARMLDDGRGIAKDKSNAFLYFKKSADQNYKPAVIKTASKLENGDGTEKDLIEAFKYYDIASKMGDKTSKKKCKELQPFMKMINEEDPQILYEYAYELYLNKRTDYALFYYKKAADKNHINAMNNLANLLLQTGDPKDSSDAEIYLKKAADKGQFDAIFNYANLMKNKGNVEEAKKYYKIILNFQNDHPKKITYSQLSAMNNYALILLEEKNSIHSIKESEKYLKLAANYGNNLSMFTLGEQYYKGTLFKQNYKTAAKYYKMAADLGHKKAMRYYAMMLTKGEGVKKDPNQAKKYFLMEATP